MSTEWIGFFGIIGGAAFALVGKYFTARFSSSAENTISLRESTMKRMGRYEARLDQIEDRMQKWINRYWSLYRWIIAFCIKNDSDIIPPPFHQMDKSEIKKELDKMDREQDNL